MFYIFSKVLLFVINPLVWIFTLLMFSLFSKKAKRKKRTLIGAILLLLFFSNIPIFRMVKNVWEIPPTLISELEQPYDVAIVLGGFSSTDTKPYDRVHFSDASTRMTTTMNLYAQGKVKNILLTGGITGITIKGKSESGLTKNFLIQQGIPSQHILIDENARNTYENAVYSAEIIKENFSPNARILLITSAFHMRRSRAVFKKIGLDFDTFAVDLQEAKISDEIFNQIVPKARVLQLWEVTIKEWIGYIVYKMKGYL